MMESGKYFVGDLCYVMSDSEWEQVVEQVIDGNQVLEGEFELADGRRFAMYNTKYGDGLYQSSIGSEHSVDSGSIGCFKLEDITANKYPDIERLGAIVDFPMPFGTGTDGSTLQFGGVFIDTSEDSEYEEDDEEYYGA